MPRHHVIDGKIIPFTAEEEAARDAEEAVWEAGKPMRKWLSDITATDGKLTRQLEDIIDALDPETRSKIAAETLDVYSAKKEVRSRKPT